MNTFIVATVIIVYALFLSRFAWHSLLWLRASAQPSYSAAFRKAPAFVYIASAIDILFFRRIFISGKMLWIGSWLFHLSLVLVGIRHLRFLCRSLPSCLILLQPTGVFAGYVLACSVFYLIILRSVRRKNRYASAYNYFILCMLLLISIIGLVMRNFFIPDLVEVKYFMLGVFGLQPQPLPDSLLFILHFSLFLVLLPYLPVHILAAPLVNLEANRRREELRFIIHDK